MFGCGFQTCTYLLYLKIAFQFMFHPFRLILLHMRDLSVFNQRLNLEYNLLKMLNYKYIVTHERGSKLYQ